MAKWKHTINTAKTVEFQNDDLGTIYIGNEGKSWVADYNILGSGSFTKVHDSKEKAVNYAKKVMAEESAKFNKRNSMGGVF